MSSTTTTDDPTAFDRLATVVGHLDHPLYDDEHQRDVWNEASAVGYQACTWGIFVFLAVAPWLGGPDASPYIVTVAAILGVAGVLAMAHAQRRGVGPWKVPGTGWARYAVAGVLLVVMILGIAAQSRLGIDVPTVAGALVGGVVGGGAAVLLMVATMRVARRRAPRGED